jgi:hypothetical protein
MSYIHPLWTVSVRSTRPGRAHHKEPLPSTAHVAVCTGARLHADHDRDALVSRHSRGERLPGPLLHHVGAVAARCTARQQRQLRPAAQPGSSGSCGPPAPSISTHPRTAESAAHCPGPST